MPGLQAILLLLRLVTYRAITSQGQGPTQLFEAVKFDNMLQEKLFISKVNLELNL